MDFKSSTVTFDTKSKFTSDMKRFACDEAARFTADSNEAAAISRDRRSTIQLYEFLFRRRFHLHKYNSFRGGNQFYHS